MSEQEYQLVVRKGPKVGQTFHLDALSLVVGRDPMSDIVINDPEVSRQHARFSRVDGGFQLEDLGSTNGTFINGQRLGSDPHVLQPGQSVGMGSGVRLIYEAVGTAQADIATIVESASPLAANLPDLIDTESPDRLSQTPTSPETDFPPAFGNPEPEPYVQAYAEQAFVTSNEGNDKSKRNAVIVVTAILMLCCCCAFLGFMYQWGGDWLLESMGMVP